MTNNQIKIKFIEDCPEVELTLWALKDELSKDAAFVFVKTVEEADLVVASRHYFIQDELDKIQGKKLIWISYGSSLKSPTVLPLSKTLDAHSYDASSKLWALFAPSPVYKNVLEEYGIDTNNVRFLGYPKMDLINYNYDVTKENSGLSIHNKTILYTPTIGWKTSKDNSSFFDYINFLVYLSLEYKFNLLVRPHPYLLNQFPEIEIILDNISKLDNVKVDYGYNYYITFKLADFIISDISSLAYEFLSTTKPVVLTTTNPQKSKVFDYYIDYGIMYEAKNKQELQNQIQLLLADCDNLKDRRETFCSKLPKNASKLIKNYIKENFVKCE